MEWRHLTENSTIDEDVLTIRISVYIEHACEQNREYDQFVHLEKPVSDFSRQNIYMHINGKLGLLQMLW